MHSDQEDETTNELYQEIASVIFRALTNRNCINDNEQGIRKSSHRSQSKTSNRYRTLASGLASDAPARDS